MDVKKAGAHAHGSPYLLNQFMNRQLSRYLGKGGLTEERHALVWEEFVLKKEGPAVVGPRRIVEVFGDVWMLRSRRESTLLVADTA